MRRIPKGIPYAILLLLAAIFGWELSAVDSSLTWTNPTTFTDGSTIPAGDLVSVQVFRKVDSGAYSLYQTVPIATSYVDADLPTGTYCYRVAVVRSNGLASAQSNEACKTVDTRIPSAATLTVN